MVLPFDKDKWELYHVAKISLRVPTSPKKHPEKVERTANKYLKKKPGSTMSYPLYDDMIITHFQAAGPICLVIKRNMFIMLRERFVSLKKHLHP